MSDVYDKQSILLKSMLLSIFLEALWMIELERKTAKKEEWKKTKTFSWFQDIFEMEK